MKIIMAPAAMRVAWRHTYKAFEEPYLEVKTIRPGRGALFFLYFPAKDAWRLLVACPLCRNGELN